MTKEETGSEVSAEVGSESMYSRTVVRPDGLYLRQVKGETLSYEKVPAERYSGEVPKKFRARHVETLLLLWELGRTIASTKRELATTRDEAIDAGCDKIALKQLEGWGYVGAAHVPVSRGDKAIGYRVCVFVTPKGDGVVEYSMSESSRYAPNSSVEVKEAPAESLAAPEEVPATAVVSEEVVAPEAAPVAAPVAAPAPVVRDLEV